MKAPPAKNQPAKNQTAKNPTATNPTATDPDDPKGLVRESYNIEGITAAECRSILMDWALSLPLNCDQAAAAVRLLAARQPDPAHPMSLLLTQVAQGVPERGRRRGGRAGRFAPTGPANDSI